MPSPDPAQPPPRSTLFATTCWTLVLAAGEGDPDSPRRRDALEQVCRAYWYPLYAFIRRRGHDPHSAEDLTQSFFARLLQRDDLAGLTREGGRFRSFLLTALNHFLVNEHERRNTLKRGGGNTPVSLDALALEERYRTEPAHQASPDRLFDRHWALALMEEGLRRLATVEADAGRSDTFESLKPFLSREPEPGEYAALAARLGIATGTLAVQVHRLRDRYRECVRTAVAGTVDNPFDVDPEMRQLLAALQDA